ncbi:MAG: hypothetical protein ABFD77_10615 [Thermotogota bacterium]
MIGSRRGCKSVAAGLCLALLVGLGVTASTSTDELAVLLYGIVRLSGSETAVSAVQARQLVPLVEVWRAELQVPPDTPPDMSGMIASIRAVLTAEQSAAIEAMHLTTADVVEWRNGGFSAYLWRKTSRAGHPLPPDFLYEEAGRVIRILNGWASV